MVVFDDGRDGRLLGVSATMDVLVIIIDAVEMGQREDRGQEI